MDAISPDKRDLVSALIKEAEDEMPKTSLHEAIHVLYSRRLGFEPEISGPEVLERDGQPWFRLAAVEPLPPKIQASGEPVSITKVFLGPWILGCNNTDADLHNFTVWYARRFPPNRTKADEILFLDRVVASVREDFKDPKFRAELQATISEVREVLKTLAPPEHREQRLQNTVADLSG